MTWRKIWFQTHWLIGITAGIVLAIVGASGALLSFEEPLLRLMNPQLTTLETAGRERLPLHELVARVQQAHADKRVANLMTSARAGDAARVSLVDASEAVGPGQRRDTPLWLDPYSGAELGTERRGEKAFHLIEDVHRRLAAGETGKAIVGLSTLLLLVLAGTGLYLRWPRFAVSLRAWFTFRLALKGRTFLWHLHAVVGTWVVLFYMLAALTGLYWSFDWYRDGLFAISDAPRPQAGTTAPNAEAPMPGAVAVATNGQVLTREESATRPSMQEDAPDAPPTPLQLDNAWRSFERVVQQYETATLTLARSAERPIEIRYLHREAPHSRAYDRMSIDPGSAAILSHELYAQKPLAHRLMGSMFVLHSGSYFGLPGLILMMLSSLLMPLFAVTGWMLYLQRRRRKVAAGTRSELAGAAGIEPATR